MQVFKGKELSYTTKWGGEPVEGIKMYVRTYENGRLGIQLTSPMEEVEDAEEPFMTCTVNLPAEDCPLNEVFVKDYSENEGCARWLMDNGVIERVPTAHAQSGHVLIERFKLTEEFATEVAMTLSRQTRLNLKRREQGEMTYMLACILSVGVFIAITMVEISWKLDHIGQVLDLTTCTTDSECEQACKKLGRDNCDVELVSL